MSNNITNTEAVSYILEVMSKEIIREVNPKLVLANLVKRFDNEAKGTNSIRVPALGNLETKTKVPNLDVQPQSPTETKVDIAINKHEEVSLVIEDFTELQTNRNLRQLYSEPISTAMARKIDRTLAELAPSVAQDVGTYNTAITIDTILAGVDKLDENDVPMEDRFFVYRHDVKNDMLDLAAFTSADFVSGKPVESGQTGNIFGLTTHMTNNLVKTVNNTNNLMFHKDAFALAMQQSPRMKAEYQLAKLGWLTVCDAIWGVKEIRPEFAVLVKT